MPIRQGTLPKAYRAVRGNPSLTQGTDVNGYKYNIEFDRIYKGTELKFDRWADGWFFIKNESSAQMTFKAVKNGSSWTASTTPVLKYCIPGQVGETNLSFGSSIAVPAGKMICLKNTVSDTGAGFSQSETNYIRFDLSSNNANPKVCIGGSLAALCPAMRSSDYWYYSYIPEYSFYRLFYTSSTTTGIPAKFVAHTDPSLTWHEDEYRYQVNEGVFKEMFAGASATYKNGLRSCGDIKLSFICQQAFSGTFRYSNLGVSVSGILDVAHAPSIYSYGIQWVDSELASPLYQTFAYCTGITTGPRVCRPQDSNYEMFYDNSYAYIETFRGCTGMTTGLQMKIPLFGDESGWSSTWIGSYTFKGTYRDCTALTHAPIRFYQTSDYANTISVAGYSFYQTFYGCSSLVSVPYYSWTDSDTMMSGKSFPRMKLMKPGYNCFEMFRGCTSLLSSGSGNHLPQDPGAGDIKIIAIDNYTGAGGHSCENMFYGCTSLAFMTYTFSYLESCSASPSICKGMFYGCTSLQTASVPNLTTGTDSLFYQTFMNCSSLVRVDGFNIRTTNSQTCYEMFRGCTSLAAAPPLLAENVYDGGSTTNNDAYCRMFYGCTSLSLIVTNQTTGDGTGTYQWTHGLPSSGRYVKLNASNSATTKNASGNTSSPHYIPYNWEILSNVLAFFSDTAYKISLVKNGSPTSVNFYYINLGANSPVTTGYNATTSPSWITGAAGKFILFWGTQTAGTNMFSTSTSNYYQFQMQNGTNGIDCFGRLSALHRYTGGSHIASAVSYTYYRLFRDCTQLRTAPDLPSIPAISNNGYNFVEIFRGCTSLSTTPAILATYAGPGDYSAAFRGCNSLTVPPDLSGITTMSSFCFEELVEDCTSLVGLVTLPPSTTALAEGCFYAMYNNCPAVTEIPDGYLPWTTLAEQCYYRLFSRCTNLNSIPYTLLPATGTLPYYCYADMFMGCTNIEDGPYLPATSLANGCYSGMFSGCVNLRNLNVNFTAWDNAWGMTSARSTDNWVYGVQTTDGNFNCPTSLANYHNNQGNLSAQAQGGNTSTTPWAIPYGWTKNNGATPVPPTSRFQFKYYSGTVTIAPGSHLSYHNQQLEYSRDGYTWYNFTSAQSVTSSTPYLCVRAKNTVSPLDNRAWSYFGFSGSGKVDVLGNLQYLFDKNGNSYNLQLAGLFENCTRIRDCSGLYFGSAIQVNCTAMFKSSSVTSVLLTFLSGVTIERAREMFSGCTSLVNGCHLDGMNTTYNPSCFYQTYYGCTSLKSLYANPICIGKSNAWNDGDAAFYEVFRGCSGSQFNAVHIQSQYLAKKSTSGYSNSTFEKAFYGCTYLNKIRTYMVRWPGTGVTKDWVVGVSNSGTFYYRQDQINNFPTGPSRAPSNWSAGNYYYY